MRASTLLVVASFLSVASPAGAAFTVTIGPTAVSGTSVVDISGPGCSVPGNIAAQCPGSGTFPFSSVVSGTANPTSVGLPADVIFRSFNVLRGQFDIDLIYEGGVLVGTSLIGFQSPSSPCILFPTGICRTEIVNFSAANFAVTLTDLSAGTSQVLTPVPEPGTWAMMLIGFGAIGASMRRRRFNAKLLQVS